MAKESFSLPETESFFKDLELLRQRSGVSRGQAFEDWLTAIVCSLAAETKEEEYMAMVERHKKGEKGKRGIDLMAVMFGKLIQAMEKTDADILGDMFQGAVTYGENGLYLTPDPVTELLARITIPEEESAEDGRPLWVNDPCCGTGRMLLEAAKINPKVELVGQDIDARCARITAINLGLRGHYGWVICGNTLSGEMQFAYRIGHFYNESENGLRRGVIRDIPPEETPVPVIRKRLRQSAGDLFESEEEPSPEQVTRPEAHSIIEIPRWLAQLEQTMSIPGSKEPSAESRPTVPPRNDPPDDEPGTQKTLFE